VTTHEPAAAPIVVGIDGSPCGQDALQWAAQQARLTHASLRAVSSWQWPDIYGYAAVPSDIDWEKAAGEVLAKSVEGMRDAFPDVLVDLRLREGHPALMLIEEAQGASLLVVGSRGHGAFAGMLLGSVSQHCVSHAPCPVVVVRTATGGRRPPAVAERPSR
jgi:nucleotide-binding universal stress UspA family protein